MENALHRFVRLLRLRQVRISIPEALDAMACAREPGMLSDKAHLKAALRVALIKDRRDEEVFDEVFDRFFALVKVGPTETGHGHGHGHEDLSDTGALEDFTLSEEPSETGCAWCATSPAWRTPPPTSRPSSWDGREPYPGREPHPGRCRHTVCGGCAGTTERAAVAGRRRQRPPSDHARRAE